MEEGKQEAREGTAGAERANSTLDHRSHTEPLHTSYGRFGVELCRDVCLVTSQLSLDAKGQGRLR